jgi:hypothetical protein
MLPAKARYSRMVVSAHLRYIIYAFHLRQKILGVGVGVGLTVGVGIGVGLAQGCE